MELLCMIGYVFNLLWIFLMKLVYVLIVGIVFLFRIIGDIFKKAK